MLAAHLYQSSVSLLVVNLWDSRLVSQFGSKLDSVFLFDRDLDSESRFGLVLDSVFAV